MSDYEQQYYILTRPNKDNIPYLTPDMNTAAREFSYERQPVGSPPLVFINGWKDRNLAEGVKDSVKPILFHGTDLVVNTAIRDSLLEFTVPDMHMHPAIYIDDRNDWHEDYWYLTFTKLFDCWDRSKSETSPAYSKAKHDKDYEVIVYEFDKDLLDKTPLENRLLFKMGGTRTAPVFCHESIAGIFRRDLPNGAKLTLVADY